MSGLGRELVSGKRLLLGMLGVGAGALENARESLGLG